MRLELTEDDLDALADRLAKRLAPRLPSTTQPESDRIFWPESDAAWQLGVSPGSLKRWRLEGHFRPAVLGRPVLYDRRALDAAAAWMKSRGE